MKIDEQYQLPSSTVQPFPSFRRGLSVILPILLLCSCFALRNNGYFERIDRSMMEKSIDKSLGVPYKYGGTTRDGLDCSGFTSLVYRENGIVLPRTAMEQWRIGEKIGRSDLHYGDLVFFNLSGGGISHVGIYLKDDNFVHAAVSKGVTTSSLSDQHFRNHYVGAKRIENSRFIVDDDSNLKVAQQGEFPLTDTVLFHSQGMAISAHRTAQLRISNDSEGDLSLNLSAGLLNWIELASSLNILHFLGDRALDFNPPGYSFKVNPLEERTFLPAISLGYERRLRKQRIVEEYAEEFDRQYKIYKGLFFNIGKHYRRSNNFFLGSGNLQVGATNYNDFKRFNFGDTMFFLAIEQQFFSRFLLVLELDDFPDSYRLSPGLKWAITSEAGIEFSISDLADLHGSKTTSNKTLTFSYNFTF